MFVARSLALGPRPIPDPTISSNRCSMLGESIIDERMERRFDVGDVGGLAEYYFNV